MKKSRFSFYPNNLKNEFLNSKSTSMISTLRDKTWDYPSLIFPLVEKKLSTARVAYNSMKPISGIIVVLVFMFGILFGVSALPSIVQFPTRLELTEGVLGVPDDLSPIYIPEFQVQKDFYALAFNTLFRVNRDGGIIGDLVESWEYKEGGKEIHLKLKDGVTWHDGEEFSASDVKFTINLFKNLKGQESYFDTVENVEVEVVSNLELVLKLERTSASFLETIIWPVLPEHILQDVPINELEYSSFGQKPIGTGPFMLSVWRGDEIELKRNESYFEGMPELKKITLKSFPSEKELVGALLTGKIDTSAEITSETISEIKGESWVGIENIPMIKRNWSVYFNFNGPEILRDKRMRQALSSAINRNKIIRDGLEEFGIESTGPIPETSWAYNPDAKRYTFNLEEANKLFGELGDIRPEGGEFLQKDGVVLEIQLAYVSNPVQDKVAESIKKDWESMGVKTNIVGLDYKTFRDTLLIPRSFDTILFGVETLLDPDHFRLWHSSQISPPGRNFASYKSSYAVLDELNRVDELLDKGRSTLDQNERADAYKRFQGYLLDEVPAAFLYHPSFIYVYNKRVTGIDISETSAPEDRFRSVLNWKVE